MDTENPIYKAYHLLNYGLQDARTGHLPLIQRPFSLFALLIIYNLVCLKFGPAFMEKRKPYNIRKAIIAFDVFQIVSNIYVFHQSLQVAWLNHYRILCAEMEFEDTPAARGFTVVCYMYFLLKLSDIFDTVFMVLRKKNQHISFLHMYHHTAMVFTAWFCAKYLPTGHHTCLGVYNTLVHSIMYTYYLVAALYPSLNLTIIKKVVTKLQMIQFITIGLHISTLAFVPNCNYPAWPMYLLLPQVAIIFALFYDFYRKTYTVKKEALKSTETSSPKSE